MVSAGESAPGGGLFESFDPPSALANGSVIFVGETDAPAGAGSDFGIYRASADDGVRALLRANSPTPGFPSGGAIGSGTALISHPTGGITFKLGETLYQIPDPSDPVPAEVITVPRRNPGTIGAIWSLSYYTLNARSEVIFSGRDNSPPDSDVFLNYGIWKWRDGARVRIIRGSEPAPGTPLVFENLVPSNSLYGRVCDDHGRVAMLVQAGAGAPEPSGRLGIWFGDERGVRFVCLQGERAPGIGATWRRPTGPTVSPVGHVAFQCTTDAPPESGITISKGIWATDIDGTLFKVVENGDQLMLRGKLRTVEDLRLNGGSDRYDYREQPINAAGQIVFSVRTEDEFSFLLRAQIPFPQEATALGVIDDNIKITLRLASRMGHRYQFETSTHPGGKWETCGDPLEGDGNELLFECPPNPGDVVRFFRARISPIQLPDAGLGRREKE